MVAWNSCPVSFGASGLCLNTTDWRTTAPFNTKMTISTRRATTVFNRSNYTILDIIDLSSPIPAIYAPSDLFAFYDIIFNVNTTQTNWQYSTPFSLLFSMANFLQRNQDNQLDSGGGSRQLRLQEFLATPFAVFNNVWFSLPGDDVSEMGKSVALAVPGYRVSSLLKRLTVVGYCTCDIVFIYGWWFDFVALVHYCVDSINGCNCS
jgi:hypothetical protein